MEKRRENRREENMKAEERSRERKWHKQSMYPYFIVLAETGLFYRCCLLFLPNT